MLFFGGMLSSILWIYMLASVLPAVILFRYIYGQSRIHRQPMDFLWSLFGQGVLAALASILLESVGTFLFSNLFTTTSRTKYYLFFTIFVIGLIEEGTKYYFLKKKTWNAYRFMTKYDGIIFAVSVGLGFAVFENIRYVFSYGLSTALIRALTAIPGHLSFAVLMGFFYGRARAFEDHRQYALSALARAMALVVPVLLHGLYDGMAMLNTGRSMFWFIVIIAVIYLIIFRLVRHEADTDRLI